MVSGSLFEGSVASWPFFFFLHVPAFGAVCAFIATYTHPVVFWNEAEISLGPNPGAVMEMSILFGVAVTEDDVCVCDNKLSADSNSHECAELYAAATKNIIDTKLSIIFLQSNSTGKRELRQQKLTA